MLPELLEGIGFVAGNFIFASLVCLALFNALFGLSYVTLLPVFADVYFNAGSVGYGLLQAAHGVGALAARSPSRRSPRASGVPAARC